MKKQEIKDLALAMTQVEYLHYLNNSKRETNTAERCEWFALQHMRIIRYLEEIITSDD